MTTMTMPPVSAEQDGENLEAELALIALMGWNCSGCRQPLRPGVDYVCCDRVHCPYCGGAYCEHQIAYKSWSEVRLRALPIRPLSFGPLGLAPLAQWTPERRREVFQSAAELLPVFFADYQAEFWKSVPIKEALIEHVIRPDRFVLYKRSSRHWHRAWFSRDPESARARVSAILNDLRAGFKKYRAKSRADDATFE